VTVAPRDRIHTVTERFKGFNRFRRFSRFKRFRRFRRFRRFSRFKVHGSGSKHSRPEVAFSVCSAMTIDDIVIQ
jgi:hypothetical protein